MTLSLRCLHRMSDLHPDLVKVVMKADEISEVNFFVTEGARSVDQQRKYVDEGKSQTMRSRHIPACNECKMSCAVDLAIWEDKDDDRVIDADEVSWKFDHYKKLAKAMQEAARIEGVPVEWGACWSDLRSGDIDDLIEKYKQSKAAKGEKPFIDAPHFQLSAGQYPYS